MNLCRMFAPNKNKRQMENKETYLGKAMIQLGVSLIFTFAAVSHESITWTIILGLFGMVWAAAAHTNFNNYERRG